jgi:hypothetical protein
MTERALVHSCPEKSLSKVGVKRSDMKGVRFRVLDSEGSVPP